MVELSCCTDGTFTHVTLILQYGLADHTIIQVQTYTYFIILHAVKTCLRNNKYFELKTNADMYIKHLYDVINLIKAICLYVNVSVCVAIHI